MGEGYTSARLLGVVGQRPIEARSARDKQQLTPSVQSSFGLNGEPSVVQNEQKTDPINNPCHPMMVHET
jgi:hypothetical protein